MTDVQTVMYWHEECSKARAKVAAIEKQVTELNGKLGTTQAGEVCYELKLKEIAELCGRLPELAGEQTCLETIGQIEYILGAMIADRRDKA